MRLKGSRERGAPLVKHSSRDSDIINSICAFAPHVHFSTMRGFVLKDLRQHDFDSYQFRQRWSGRVEEFEGVRGFITNNNNGHLSRMEGESSKSCSSWEWHLWVHMRRPLSALCEIWKRQQGEWLSPHREGTRARGILFMKMAWPNFGCGLRKIGHICNYEL